MTIQAFSSRLPRFALAAAGRGFVGGSRVRPGPEAGAGRRIRSEPGRAGAADPPQHAQDRGGPLQGRDARPQARASRSRRTSTSCIDSMKQRQDQVVKDIDEIVEQIKISKCNSGGQGESDSNENQKNSRAARPQPGAEPGQAARPEQAAGSRRTASSPEEEGRRRRGQLEEGRASGRERPGRSARPAEGREGRRTSTSTRSGATSRTSSARSSSTATTTTSLLSTRSRSRSTSARRGRPPRSRAALRPAPASSGNVVQRWTAGLRPASTGLSPRRR